MSKYSRSVGSKVKKKDLDPIASYVNEIHERNLLSLTTYLDRAIYMLHYIPQNETFSELERQNTCYALMGLKERLMEVHHLMRGLTFDRWD